MTESIRLKSLDSLRGLASLAVCWFHLTGGYSDGSLVKVSGKYGWLGVDVFFVISGFIIPYAMYKSGYEVKKDWRVFIGKRILRIDPPYLAAALLAASLWYLSTLIPSYQGPLFNPSALQLALHIAYLNGIAGYPWLNPVFWTLAIEFQYYLLVAAFFGFISSARASFVAITAIFFVLSSLFFQSEVLIFKYLGLFLLGIAVFQYRVGLIDKFLAGVVLSAAAVSVYFVHGLPGMFAATLTALIIGGNWNLGSSKILEFLGAISYSLYLVHIPIGGRVVNIGRRLVDGGVGELVISLTALAICIFSAWVFYSCFERPAQMLASRWKYRGSKEVVIHMPEAVQRTAING